MAGSAEFMFLMRREKVHEAVIEKLVAAGVTTVKMFANLAKTPDEIRELAASSLGMANRTLEDKVKISGLICAYNAAAARTTEMDKLDAQHEVNDKPKVLLTQDFDDMRKAFEAAYWQLSITEVPGKTMVEILLAALEKKKLKVEKLTEIISLKEDDGDELRPVWNADGTMKAVKTGKTVPLPTTTEELRARLMLLAVCWCFCGYAQTANPIFVDVKPIRLDRVCKLLTWRACVQSEGKGPRRHTQGSTVMGIGLELRP